MNQTIDCSHSRLTMFALELAALSPWHVRRLGLHLAQFGILITAGSFCVSIAGMNIGLTASLVGCILAGAPLHRLVGFRPLLLLTALLAASTAAQHNWGEFVRTAVLPIGLLTAQVALHNTIPWSARLRRALVVTLWVTITLSIIVALGQFCIGRGNNRPFRISSDGYRFFQSSGFFSIHLTQGAAMGMLFFLVGAFAHVSRHRWSWLVRGACALGVFISGARSALLGFTASVVASSMTRGRNFAFFSVVGGTTVLSTGLLILLLTSSERFTNLVAMKDGRWPIWRTSLVIIEQNPWLGTGGSEGYREAYRSLYPTVVLKTPSEFPQGAPHAHNTQLAQASEHGIPFAAAWLLLLSIALWRLARHRQTSPTLFHAALGLGVMAIVFGQFEKFDGECSRILWTGLGLLLALTTHHPHESHHEPLLRMPQSSATQSIQTVRPPTTA